MDERSHQENLYALLRDAKKQKFLGQDNMVVNSGSLLVKRCQQAKEMHGITAAATSNHSKEGIRTEDATTVHDRLSGRTGSGGLGTPHIGDEVRVRYASQLFPRANGPRERRRRTDAQDTEGMDAIRSDGSVVGCTRQL